MRATTVWLALCLGAWCGSMAMAVAGTNLTLVWDAPRSKNSNVVGYNVYWGNESNQLTGFAYAGHRTAFTVSNLAEGLVFYFVVTAVDANGQESNPSNQLSFTVPGPPRVAIQRDYDDQVRIRVPGTRGRLMRLEASDNLLTWECIWEGTPDRDDWLTFGESHASSPRRFYRAVLPP